MQSSCMLMGYDPLMVGGLLTKAKTLIVLGNPPARCHPQRILGGFRRPEMDTGYFTSLRKEWDLIYWLYKFIKVSDSKAAVTSINVLWRIDRGICLVHKSVRSHSRYLQCGGRP